MLSWVRTATALISFGFSIQQFFRITRAGAPERDQIVGPDEFGFAMIVVGLLALLLQVQLLPQCAPILGIQEYARVRARESKVSREMVAN
jgi:uncharacterized membrane protein YidH (DUF202 family)